MYDSSPQKTSSWQKLVAHHQSLERVGGICLRTCFAENPKRFEQFSLSVGSLLLDYSKNLILEETRHHLIKHAEALAFEEAREAFFSGKAINISEDRAVLHPVLRGSTDYLAKEKAAKLSFVVEGEKKKMKDFVQNLHQKKLLGYSGNPIKQIVLLGIGGASLGAEMVCQALKPFSTKGIQLHFVSNLDPSALQDTLLLCKPEETFFIVSSKSFGTEETLANAAAARSWLRAAAKDDVIAQHFAAISANEAGMEAMGISKKYRFYIWDWVGGRFSLWSAVGLPIACLLGYDAFVSLLEGARQMDEHFLRTSAAQNMPLLLALLSLWYGAFYSAKSHAVLCYAEHLTHFVPFLQQLSMESNGKSVDLNQQPIKNYPTAPVLWGGIGTQGQHAYHQLLHQGTEFIPCDFIAVIQPEHPAHTPHQHLLSHCLAQSQSLMMGSQAPSNAPPHQVPYRAFSGNRPSNTILVERLVPEALGALIALYEHKVFCEGLLWNVPSFDQWGVELGKKVAPQVLSLLQEGKEKNTDKERPAWDASTLGLAHHIRCHLDEK